MSTTARCSRSCHDREPTLPKEIQEGLSTVDDITINIWKRTRKDPNYSGKLPMIELRNWGEDR